MNCQEAQPLIDDYLDGLLDSSQREQLTAHLNQCVDCAEASAQERQFRQMLKSAPLPPPSTGFVDRALRQAVQQAGRQGSKSHHVSHRQGFIKGFGSAIAAGLVVWAVMSMFPTHQEVTTQTPVVSQVQNQSDNVIRISLLEPTNIQLAFHAAQAVQDATITISLSDNLELVGYQNRQTLEWKTSLNAGDNLLTLPIKALKPQQGKIVAQVTHNNLMKSIELKLDVKNNTGANKPVSNNNIIITPVA